jgi:hypothetical protein
MRFQGHFHAQVRMWIFMQSARYCCPMLTKIGMCSQNLVKFAIVKFHENLLSSSRVTCGQTDGQVGMAKLIGAIFAAL